MDERTARSCHSDGMRQSFLWVFLTTHALFLVTPSVGYTQVPVVTDITSSGLGTVVPLQAPSDGIYNITGGTRPGDGPNLFHSFGGFSVGPGDIANFLNTPVNGSLPLTSNILGRVTGGNVSNIYGTIQTTDFGNANLFLVNPSGIVLGPTGSVNVTGSVSFTTTQYLRLFDGVNSANFYANSSNDGLANSVLAVAPVVDFGFLSPAAYGFLTPPDPSASITVQGSALRVPIIFDSETGQPKGSTLSLVGGDINIIADPDTGTPAALTAPSGHINLVSVTSPGEILFQGLATGPNVNGASFTTMGTVTIKEGATLDVSGQLDEFGTPIGNGSSGTVFVRGGQLVMDTSTILAVTVGAVDGERAAVDIQVSQDVALTNGSTINTITSGTGHGGEVQLTARNLTIENAPQSILTATVDGGGVGGDVVLNVETVSLMGGSQILSLSQTSPPESGLGLGPGLGHGGNVTIQGLPGAEFGAATSVTFSGDSSLLSLTIGGPGEGGRVAITSESVKMEGFATTVASTTQGVGLPGDIVVSVQHANLSGGATITTLSGSTDSNAPEAATVTVQGLGDPGSMADSVALSGLGSGIVSDTQGLASAGDVAVHAKTVSLTDGAAIQSGTPLTSGAGGIVTIDAGSVDISGGSIIRSLANRAAAGEIIIMANTLILANGFIASKTVSSSRGGDVELNVGTVSLSNSATIDSSASGTGRAGDITMNVGALSLANGSSISSASIGTEAVTNPDGTTQAPGTAGNVVITASGSFTSDASTVATSAEANHGGDVSITAHSVQLSNGTLITANSNGPLEVKETVLIDGQLVEQVVGDGNAGNITAHSGSTFVMSNSSMTTEASQASGGQIVITAPEMVRLTNSQVNTTVAGSETDTAGGDIMIDPQFVVLQNSQVLAQAFAGTGGNITIISNVFIADPISLVDASSQLGISGQINIQSPVQNVGEQLTPLSEQFSSAAALLAQQCAARAVDGKFSTFMVAAREGLPAEPGGFLASPSLTSDLHGSHLSGQEPHTQLSAVTGLIPKHNTRPIQLAKLGGACR